MVHAQNKKSIDKQIIDFAIKNENNKNITTNDVKEKFNISITQTHYYIRKIRQYDDELYHKIRKILQITPKDYSKNKKPLYEVIAKYIINNNVSYQDTAINFDISINKVYNHVRNCRLMRPQLYKELKETLYSQKEYIKMANYVIENNASKDEVINTFKITTSQISSRLLYLKKNNINLYKKIKKIWKETKTTKGELYAQYIIKNQTTYKQTADHFNTTDNNIRVTIYNLKKTNKDLYNQVIKSITRKIHKHKFKNKEEKIANYIINNNSTYKQAANYFGTSYSNIEMIINRRLKNKNYSLYKEVKNNMTLLKK